MINWLRRFALEWLFDGLEPRQYGEWVIWTRAYDHYPWRDYWCPACGRKLTEYVGQEECRSCGVSYGKLDGRVGLAKAGSSGSNLEVSEHETRMKP